MWHIIGAGGYIGSRLVARIPKEESCLRYRSTPQNCDQLIDLRDFNEDVFDRINENDFVVFLAGISSPDLCEREYERSYEINVIGTKRFIKGCIDRRANVLFFSSDVVNGPTTPFPVDENYEGIPVGKYGEMKKTIERKFAGNPRFKVFRLSYVYSREDKFSRYLDECSAKRETPEVFDALYRNPIYIEDIFEGIFKLKESFCKWENSIFNLSGPELLSRKDIAIRYVKNVDKNMRFVTINPPQGFFDARPNVIATKSLYLEDLLGRLPTNIDAAMAREYKVWCYYKEKR